MMTVEKNDCRQMTVIKMTVDKMIVDKTNVSEILK